MKKSIYLSVVLALILLAVPMSQQVMADALKNYGNVTLTSSGTTASGHFGDIWDLTAGDMVLSFTYDATGMVDDAGAHAWAELGVRSLSSCGVDFNPYWRYTYWTKTVDLVVGRKMEDVGNVVVWGDGETLYVRFEVTKPGCYITETHVAIADSLTKIPQANGNPIPGVFQYNVPHNPAIPEYTQPVDATQWPPTTKLYIAAHASLVCACGETPTAWGKGTGFSGKNWGMYFTYTPIKEAGSGVWLATDYDYTPNTFDPDTLVYYPPPIDGWYGTLDLDDKLILQRQGGQGEGAYNLPSTPPAPGDNHRVWWDRDGVDPWQNDETANTGGIYQIEIRLSATSATAGTAYVKIRSLWQGFEVDGNWNTIELTPAGMTFTGDMKHLQVFYGLYGYGATHAVSFNGITVVQGTALNEFVGSTTVPLEGRYNLIRTQETNLGNLVADMMKWAAGSGVQIALMNSAGIRGNSLYPAGAITRYDVYRWLPFTNTLVMMDLTGAQIRQALENGVSQVEIAAGRFPQVSGLRFTWDDAQPPGSRVVDVSVGGVPLVDTAVYRLATIDFLAEGGDGYTVLTQGTNFVDTGTYLMDYMVEYLKAFSPVNPTVEGRILVV
jgi:hypothetical protein